MIHVHPRLNYIICSDKTTAEEGFLLGHIVADEKVGIGFPFIRNVYRANAKGDFGFSYHHKEELYEKDPTDNHS